MTGKTDVASSSSPCSFFYLLDVEEKVFFWSFPFEVVERFKKKKLITFKEIPAIVFLQSAANYKSLNNLFF